MHSKSENSNAVFKILDAQLLVRRVRPDPAYLIAHNTSLQAGAIALYNMTRVELKTFTFAKGLQCHIGTHTGTSIRDGRQWGVSRLPDY